MLHVLVLNKYIGESEANLRVLVNTINKLTELDIPTLLFIDEADTLLSAKPVEREGEVAGNVRAMVLNLLSGESEQPYLYAFLACNHVR